MDVRESINAENNCSVITGADQDSYVESDSFYARAPPLAASTVARTKARRHFHQDLDTGSFLDEVPSRVTPPVDTSSKLTLGPSFSAAETGARPKLGVTGISNTQSETLTGPGLSRVDWNDAPPGMGNMCDWPEYDGQSSLGILNEDEMDLSANNLLVDMPRALQVQNDSEKTPTAQDFYDSSLGRQHSMKEQVSSSGDTWKFEGSSSNRFDGGLSSSGHDSKPDQPFARSQLGTVKKPEKTTCGKDPIVSAIKQSLFGQGTIGEEGEDGDASVYNVHLEVEDLHSLDDEFGEMNSSIAGDSDGDEVSPVKKAATGTVSVNGEGFQLDSIYLRPGTTGEEQSKSKLTYLSKVSLFDVGSGSEIDTEDELEQARQAQGMRHEAAGEASHQDTSRPGLEGEDQVPITQRQSAEGDVVSSPVPGDGGGGGDGSSGSDTDDGQGSDRPDLPDLGYQGNTATSLHSGGHSNMSSLQQQEQRIRPMGDDLLSELRFSNYARARTNQADEDDRLSSRYLTPNVRSSNDDDDNDDDNQASFNVDNFLGTTTDQEFDPGNRLEASGFNADDLSALNNKGLSFDMKSSSFGSFGLVPPQPDSIPDLCMNDQNDSMFGMERVTLEPDDDRRSSQEKYKKQEEGTAGSSGASSTKSSTSSYVDLAVKSAFSNATEQQEVLLQMDVVVNDQTFFGNDNPLAMLDEAEEEFERENIIRQDEEMKNTGSPNESWAYHSTMSIARPSWLENHDGEDKVRISVGTYMRGRTETLGSLDGDGHYARPDFGMDIKSPPPPKKKPCPLVDVAEDTEVFESTRTSGVGEYECATPVRSKCDDTGDNTLTDGTMPSSAIKAPDFTLSATILDYKSLGLANVNGTMAAGSSGNLNAADLSMMLKGNQKQPMSPSKTSHLPVRKESSLSRSFPKVCDSDKSVLKIGTESRRKESSSDSGFKGSSVTENGWEAAKVKDVEISNKTSSPKTLSPRLSNQSSAQSEDIWASPNASSCCPNTTAGLLDRLDEFKFAETAAADSNPNLRQKSAEDIKETFKAQYSIAQNGRIGNDFDRFARTDREKTPPPDGDDRQGRIVVKKLSPKKQPISSLHGDDVSSKNFNDFLDSANRKNVGSARKLDGENISRNNIQNEPSMRGDYHNESRSNSSMMDHGYMPGHHIPDGTEYSQRSDYAHMDHKGQLREDVAGTDDVGLAESRGFDILKSRGKDRVQHTDDKNVINNIGSAGRTENITDKLLGVPGQSKNSSVLNLQPTQSKSPMIKTSTGSHVIPSQTVPRNTSEYNSDDGQNVDNQSYQDKIKRQESWTQTSLVLRESVDVQLDKHQNECKSAQFENTANDINKTRNQSMNASGIPPKRTLSSFKHNLLPDNQTTVPNTPHLLTNQSLMKTDFAEDNLRRDFSMRVMDKIYSGKKMDSFEQMNATHSDTLAHLNGRESLETQANWQHLEGRESMDTTGYDFSRLSEIHKGMHVLPCGQSTPFPHGQPMFDRFGQSQTSMMGKSGHYQSQISTGDLSIGQLPSDNLSKVCPVEAPGVLKFKEACCVGISRKEVLQLRNPTDRWMECLIKAKFLEIDGHNSSLDVFPFEMRQKKVIIDPYKCVGMDVMFLPKFAGAYVAQVQVYSLSCWKKDQIDSDVIPVNVTFQAIAEEPCIKVTCEDQDIDEVDFGEMTWGSCLEKTISIRNKGHSTVPLRLAITSNKAWHCFSFEPEGRMSEVSIISGRHPPSSGGRSIINISLPGANQPFSYHEVRVWCRPPEKQSTDALSRQSPEVFRCSVEIEVDTPCSRAPKLHSLYMMATVGVRKLHLKANQKELQISSRPKHVEETQVSLFNAGNLSLTATFLFSEHKDVYSVSPSTLTLRPSVEGQIRVAFHPEDVSVKNISSLLLMMILPEGPIFELQVEGRVIQEVLRDIKLLCDRTVLDFGGVAVGKTCVKRYRLKNADKETINLTARVMAESVLLARTPESTAVGTKLMELTVQPDRELNVYVRYCPSTLDPLSGKVTMRPVERSSIKYTVQFTGYGGVSRLHCSEESTESRSVKGYLCVGVHSFSMERVKEVFVHNLGARSAIAKVAVYSDLKCSERLLSGKIVIQPSEFVIAENGRQKLEIVVSMTETEFSSREARYDVGAVLNFTYKDLVESAKPFESQLIVGLVKGPSPSVVPQMATPTRSTRPIRFSTFPEIPDTTSHHSNSQHSNSQHSNSHHSNTSNQLSDRSDVSVKSGNSSASSSSIDNTGGWSIKPNKLVLYCSNRGGCDDYEKLFIYNNNNTREIRFEIVWSGKMLSLTHDSGTVLGRENKYVKVYPSMQVLQNLADLPVTGQIMVTVNGVMKSVKVELRRDIAPLTDHNVPEPGERRLVPIQSNMIQTMTGTNRIGNLEVSETVVQFPATRAGKTCEQTIELRNTGSDVFRWMFTSFASPYLRKKAEASKETFRVSYKVFDFSKQFGKLAGKESIELTLQFMPRSTGTFSQYWDLQTSGNTGSEKPSSARQDFIRVHLTGEGLEDPAETSSKGKIDVENLLPEMLSGTSTGLRLDKSRLDFPCIRRGDAAKLKIELKNGHIEEIQVAVTTPKPPFYVKYSHLKISRKKYLRLPIEFHPSRPGKYSDVVKFQGSKGETLVLQISGECKMT